MADMNNVKSDDKNSRGMVLDIIVSVLAVLALCGCCFFWNCKYDLPATILSFAIVLAGSGFLLLQHRKNRVDANL